MLPVLSFAMLSACAQANLYRKPTPLEERSLIWEEDLNLRQQTYVLGLRKEPLDFETTGSLGDKAWIRAGDFIAEHCAMKVVESTQTRIRTKTSVAPAGYVPKTCETAYLIEREPRGMGYVFHIRTSVAVPDWVPCEIGRRRTARILSRYLRTGELAHPEFIEK